MGKLCNLLFKNKELKNQWKVRRGDTGLQEGLGARTPTDKILKNGGFWRSKPYSLKWGNTFKKMSWPKIDIQSLEVFGDFFKNFIFLSFNFRESLRSP